MVSVSKTSYFFRELESDTNNLSQHFEKNVLGTFIHGKREKSSQ